MIQIAAAMMAMMLAQASPGQAHDIYKDCNGGEATGRIVDACSAVLQRGSLESSDNRKQAFFYRGYAYQRLHQLDESFADYRASLAIDPDYFPSKNNLSVGLTDRGADAYRFKNYDQARADFAESVKLYPDNVQSLTIWRRSTTSRAISTKRSRTAHRLLKSTRKRPRPTTCADVPILARAI